MNWTLQQIAERIIDEPFRAIGEDVRERQIAMILTWLETVQRQERERCARLICVDCGDGHPLRDGRHLVPLERCGQDNKVLSLRCRVNAIRDPYSA